MHRTAIAFIAGLLLTAGASHEESRREAQFKCSRFIPPRIQCEAKYVWPILPYWQVYYPGTSDVVEYDDGIVVFLTLPREKFARIEMCLNRNHCLVTYGGWFGEKLLFRREAP